MFVIFLFLFFVKVYADCTQLSFTAEYSIKHKFDVECSGVLSAKNGTVSLTDAICVPNTNQFILIEPSLNVNGQGEKNCSTPENCSIESGTIFLKLYFQVKNGPSLNSYPIMSVVDNGLISFANGGVIQNNQTYYGKQKSTSYPEMIIKFTRRCQKLISVSLPSPQISPCQIFSNDFKILKAGLVVVSGNFEISLFSKSITGKITNIQPTTASFQYKYNNLKSFTHLKLSETANKFLFTLYYNTTDNKSLFFSVGKLIIRNGLTMMEENVQFSNSNKCYNSENINLSDGYFGESYFCCKKFTSVLHNEL